MYEIIKYLVLIFLGFFLKSIYDRFRNSKTAKARTKAIVTFMIELLICAVIFAFLQYFNPESPRQKKAMQEKALAGCDDFHAWLKTNNDLFEDSLNTAMDFYGKNSKVMYNKDSLTAIIAWAKEYRKKRDHCIDSMTLGLRKYENSGCDPDTISFDRRLPIRLEYRLKPYLDLHKFDPKKLGLDTL